VSFLHKLRCSRIAPSLFAPHRAAVAGMAHSHLKWPARFAAHLLKVFSSSKAYAHLLAYLVITLLSLRFIFALQRLARRSRLHHSRHGLAPSAKICTRTHAIIAACIGNDKITRIVALRVMALQSSAALHARKWWRHRTIKSASREEMSNKLLRIARAAAQHAGEKKVA